MAENGLDLRTWLTVIGAVPLAGAIVVAGMQAACRRISWEA